MLSFRYLSLLLLASLLPYVMCANPGPGEDVSPFCMLDTIQFTNGVKLADGQFWDSRKFEWMIDCPPVPLTTVITPRSLDPESSVEITMNGVPIHKKSMETAISNSGNLAHSPYTQSNPLTFQQGPNTIVVGVSCNGLGMPVPCYYRYSFYCTCKPDQGGSVIGDPQFTGLRGQSYQVHGVSGEIYNIVSDPAFQLNSRFVFLDHGKCPVVNGKKQKGCFAHAGSYLGEIGLKTRAGDKVRLQSGSADHGFAAVEINGKAVQVGDSVLLADGLGSVSFNNTHTVSVEVDNWSFVYENSDMYVNQAVRVLNPHTLRSHGLLGQTWRQKTYNNAIKHIQGMVDDYVIREKDIFGDSFVYNVFN